MSQLISKKSILKIVITIIIVCNGFFLWQYIKQNFKQNYSNLTSDTFYEMRYCVSDSDCAPVDCTCSCNDCDAKDDIINKKYVDTWYGHQKCNRVCPEVCPMWDPRCSPLRIVCENNQCGQKEIIIVDTNNLILYLVFNLMFYIPFIIGILLSTIGFIKALRKFINKDKNIKKIYNSRLLIIGIVCLIVSVIIKYSLRLIVFYLNNY